MIYLLPAAIAWVVAQGAKHVFGLLGRNRRIFGGEGSAGLLPSGGMPSVHTAFVTSITVFMGLQEGLGSPLFALAVVVSAVVIYDSLNVRYASGQQGGALNALIEESKSDVKPVHVVHGHKPLEVMAGAVIGSVVAVVVFITTK